MTQLDYKFDNIQQESKSDIYITKKLKRITQLLNKFDKILKNNLKIEQFAVQVPSDFSDERKFVNKNSKKSFIKQNKNKSFQNEYNFKKNKYYKNKYYNKSLNNIQNNSKKLQCEKNYFDSNKNSFYSCIPEPLNDFGMFKKSSENSFQSFKSEPCVDSDKISEDTLEDTFIIEQFYHSKFSKKQEQQIEQKLCQEQDISLEDDNKTKNDATIQDDFGHFYQHDTFTFHADQQLLNKIFAEKEKENAEKENAEKEAQLNDKNLSQLEKRNIILNRQKKL